MNKKHTMDYLFGLTLLLGLCWSALYAAVDSAESNLFYGMWCLCGLLITGLMALHMNHKP